MSVSRMNFPSFRAGMMTRWRILCLDPDIVFPAPQLQEHEREEPFRVVQAAPVPPNQVADHTTIEEPPIGLLEDGRHIRAPHPVEPSSQWDGESLLARQVEGMREEPPCQLPQQYLPVGACCQCRVGDGSEGELDDAMIQERGANLQRGEHARSIHFDQYIVRQVSAKVADHRLPRGRQLRWAGRRLELLRTGGSTSPSTAQWSQESRSSGRIEIQIDVRDTPTRVTPETDQLMPSSGPDGERTAKRGKSLT